MNRLTLTLLLLLPLLAGCGGRLREETRRQNAMFDELYHRYQEAKLVDQADWALDCATQIDSLAEAWNSRYGRIVAHINHACEAATEGDFGRSLSLLDKAYSAMDRADGDLVKAYALTAESYIYSLQGQYNESVNKCLEAEPVFERRNDSLLLYKLLVNRSTNYQNQREFAKAHATLQTASQWAPRHLAYTAELYLASSSIVMGNIAEGLETNEVVLCHLQAMARRGDTNHHACMLYATNQYRAYHALQEPDSVAAALALIRAVAPHFAPQGELIYHSYNALYLMGLGRCQEAEHEYLCILNECGDQSSPEVRCEAVRGLTRVYECLGRKELATSYALRLAGLADTLAKEATKDYERQIELRLQSQQQLDRMEQHYRTVRWRWTLALSLLVIAVLAMTIVMMHRRLRVKQHRIRQMERELIIEQQKHALNESQMAHVQSKESFRDFLQKIRDIAIEAPKQLRTKLLMEINLWEERFEDDTWQQFEEAFRQEHGDFSERLRAAFPELSDSDLRHCMLIRCGKDNKEITAMLHLAPNTIKTYRMRLRKKLGLEQSDTPLNDFLLDF